jgi:hypothetical protein
VIIRLPAAAAESPAISNEDSDGPAFITQCLLPRGGLLRLFDLARDLPDRVLSALNLARIGNRRSSPAGVFLRGAPHRPRGRWPDDRRRGGIRKKRPSRRSRSACCLQCLPIGRPSVKSASITCSVENCGRAPIAKGLCRTHYSRLRRTGNPSVRGKPGCAPDKSKALVLALFPEWSRRTQERYWMAFKRLRLLCELQNVAPNAADSPYMKAHKICTRPNGSLNVNKLSQAAESMCAMHLARMEDPT